jgi:hypothetical protein
MIGLAQTVHLSCTNTNTISKQKETRFDLTHFFLKFHRVRPNQFLSIWYVRPNHEPILYQDYHYPPTDWNELPLEPHHLGVPSGASKMISDPMVHVAQTVHLSCTEHNTVSKRIETRFHLTHFTLELHQVRPNWFLILWYVRREPCTYLAPTLTLSLKGPK